MVCIGMGDDLADYVVAKTKSSAPLLIKCVFPHSPCLLLNHILILFSLFV